MDNCGNFLIQRLVFNYRFFCRNFVKEKTMLLLSQKRNYPLYL
ncbi:hypothetical protein DFO55_103590 [Grimontella sp. AG753]|uniref:Uncharacterized protein n=1 Tax=Phytobacter diazotrophicus TaxID=395631 RepID=A0ABM7W224_9ENTR|nr:hypothetical protein DFO55_103590 [Grimontella sp. AG753]TCW43330.1 hypothetical protein EDC53_11786 [Phytobacter diazotrophicus]SLK20971.1 hypothetical protein SAMN03159434_12320 [Enterobacter sp. NFR05]BDD53602.1 hypothetical protein PDTA9734_50890 [Phytobacter diazotrophicus]BEG84532.1 hypothetical protein PDTA9730_49880 [Phytobacter diazotrophicus]